MNDHDSGWITTINLEELCTICAHARLKAHNSVQFLPFYTIYAELCEFRRGSRGTVENAVARQISVVFEET